MQYPIVKVKDANDVEFDAYEIVIGNKTLHVDVKLANMYRLGAEEFVAREIAQFKKEIA